MLPIDENPLLSALVGLLGTPQQRSGAYVWSIGEADQGVPTRVVLDPGGSEPDAVWFYDPSAPGMVRALLVRDGSPAGLDAVLQEVRQAAGIKSR